MNVPEKSDVEEIRRRFDGEVERFSSIETGQTSTMDAALVLDLVADSAARTNPSATGILDIGCGAGNFTLKMLRKIGGLDCTLVDLSAPMLERARERVSRETSGRVETIQGDIRTIALPEAAYDLCVAAAVLHHLREPAEWRTVFAAIFRSLRPKGTLWVADLVSHESPALQGVQWERYRQYLIGLGGEDYQRKVFRYVEREDTPRSLGFQFALLTAAGFDGPEVLHKNGVFAAYCATRP